MLVLIAGPYTAGAPTPEARARNLEAMNRAGLRIIELGHTPVVCANLALPLIDAAGPEHFERLMMPVALALAARCDAGVRIGGPSAGADLEIDALRRAGRPVFDSIGAFADAHPGPPREVIASAQREFERYRGLAEKAAAQVAWEDLRVAIDPETNSIAVIMKHLAGNLRSRWTDFLSSDGEKPWRDRDAEFVDDFVDHAALQKWWGAGWDVLAGTLATLTDADLSRIVHIRGEPHSVALALERSLAHTAYHTGQITLLARALASKAGRPWATLTVPRGGTRAHNRSMGYDPGAGGAR